MAQERRGSKRTSMPSALVIKKLGGGGEKKDVDIDILDVSKTGIGFTCSEPLQIGEVYESFLTIWTKEVIHAFLRITRVEMGGDGYHYGALFIGMPEMDSARIEVYQTINDSQ